MEVPDYLSNASDQFPVQRKTNNSVQPYFIVVVVVMGLMTKELVGDCLVSVLLKMPLRIEFGEG